jgi:serine/threonine protein kinase
MGNACGNFDSRIIEIGQYKIKTKKALARGGYGFVYLVQDMSKHQYALKILGRANAEAKKYF